MVHLGSRSILAFAWVLWVSTLIQAEVPEGDIWNRDFGQSQLQASEKDLPMVIWFTGSDWCVWCQKLEAELFTEAAFRGAAGKEFIPVILDFPHRTSQPLGAERQNRLLQRRFSVESFPTVIWLCPRTGVELHRHGYLKIGSDEYLQALQLAASRCSNDP